MRSLELQQFRFTEYKVTKFKFQLRPAKVMQPVQCHGQDYSRHNENHVEVHHLLFATFIFILFSSLNTSEPVTYYMPGNAFQSLKAFLSSKRS